MPFLFIFLPFFFCVFVRCEHNVVITLTLDNLETGINIYLADELY